MTDLEQTAIAAKTASSKLNTLCQSDKNRGLYAVANALTKMSDKIISANNKDISAARQKGMKDSLIDRLTLTPDRIESMAEGIRQVAALPDPVGEIIEGKIRPNGLQILKKRVPIGVIGIIYESRPNVTADAFALCFKSGNACILRGGSDALNSNIAITSVIQDALCEQGLPKDSISLLTDTSRETAAEFMRLNKYLDLLIPRGGAGLINTVINQSTVPVIQTGTGNCHIYVDEYADKDMAINIITNAKTQRTGVCNACESLVIHKKIADKILPEICHALKNHSVEIRGDETARGICPDIIPANDIDYYTEYLDLIISVKTVNGIDEAINHINEHGTGHSECIVTNNYASSEKFLNEVDAAAVYVNASTRFTDGFEFGLGAEIGISTQKLHARGPMGLYELTTFKYIVRGNGQIRG